jgi:hypothetical protein
LNRFVHYELSRPFDKLADNLYHLEGLSYLTVSELFGQEIEGLSATSADIFVT